MRNLPRLAPRKIEKWVALLTRQVGETIYTNNGNREGKILRIIQETKVHKIVEVETWN